ncbi:hypothetical protein TRFO_02077 [Tritrichomonas foetus]|uniref:Uncharacterized protein n=1 Tax=Tritrichomonas foetus TaxID=1144522 RepID=A0A1J4JIB7_9EUKA|nr:hypothetical protein TRFO_02077 [Tritrichomonas foetus]|eukprot:OHS96940.1 hypothetical protein TRFO_02077 [Tritrichomonas foetus]
MSSKPASPSGFNVSSLKEIDNNFSSNLNAAQKLLKASDTVKFFNIVLSHFENNLNPETGDQILQTIRILLRREKILDKVAENSNVLLNLPFDQEKYTDRIYDIIFDIFQLEPALFTQELAKKDKFGKCVHYNPRKCLALIGQVAKRYVDNDETIENPWPFLDLLLKQSAAFAVPELIPSYLSVVVYLNQNSDEYREARLEDSWKKTVNLLNKCETFLLRPIYTSLCYLRDEFTKLKLSPELPIEQIINHLSVREAQGPALALLVESASKKPTEIADEKLLSKLISKLLAVAEEDKNMKATIVLMNLASDKHIAKLIFGNGNWLLKKLPEQVDTLRLFLVIFNHPELRPTCADHQNFIDFLKVVVEELGSSGAVTIVCTIIRRIPLNKDIIEEMNKKGFIRSFIENAKATNDDTKVSYHSLLLFLNTLAEQTYLDIFLEIVNSVVDTIMNDKNLCEIASYVAVTFVKYPQLRDRMLALKLDVFFRNIKDEKKLKRLLKNAERFLKAVAK